ncbi:MAG: L-histidine N(alpha)-methyltransferase [Pseudomonadota bacterium]|jgi:L-histidine N-alpha-methyltransferase
MKTPQFFQLHHEDGGEIRAELLRGLQAAKAYTSPKYLYDALGSKLFEAICELPEYYPTRTEAAIFAEHAQSMASHIPQSATLVDLGAGNCQKAACLFEALQPSRYVAIDISVDFLQDAMTRLQYQHPDLDMIGVGMDFAESLAPPKEALEGTTPRVFFYPGSSIGNFTPDEALAFLQRIRTVCSASNQKQGGLLIGVDLVKGKTELEAAYDDALGVTAAFNRNMLLHINCLIDSNFNILDWSHVALYNEQLARIEMHLQATRDVALRWSGYGETTTQRSFAKGERIHTENSYKWTVDGFGDLLQNAGFAKPIVWTDVEQKFAVMWAAI